MDPLANLIFSSYKLCEGHINPFGIVQHHDDVVDDKHQSMHRKHRVNGCDVASIQESAIW
jgi:hypothetical protein